MILNDAGPVLGAAALTRIGSYVGETPRFATIEDAEVYIRASRAPFGEHTDAEWRFLTEIVMRRDGDAWVRHHDPALAVPFKSDAADRHDRCGICTTRSAARSCRCAASSVRPACPSATHAEMATRGPKADARHDPGVGHAPTFLHEDQIAIAKRRSCSKGLSQPDEAGKGRGPWPMKSASRDCTSGRGCPRSRSSTARSISPDRSRKRHEGRRVRADAVEVLGTRRSPARRSRQRQTPHPARRRSTCRT